MTSAIVIKATSLTEKQRYYIIDLLDQMIEDEGFIIKVEKNTDNDICVIGRPADIYWFLYNLSLKYSFECM